MKIIIYQGAANFRACTSLTCVAGEMRGARSTLGGRGCPTAAPAAARQGVMRDQIVAGWMCCLFNLQPIHIKEKHKQEPMASFQCFETHAFY